jgi:hypothetical protein
LLISVTFGILPSELEQRLTATDFQRLSAYYRLNPWGPWRDDLRVAQLTAMTFNINRGKNQQAMTAQEFIYDPIATMERQKRHDESMLTLFDNLAAAEANNNG